MFAAVLKFDSENILHLHNRNEWKYCLQHKPLSWLPTAKVLTEQNIDISLVLNFQCLFHRKKSYNANCFILTCLSDVKPSSKMKPSKWNSFLWSHCGLCELSSFWIHVADDIVLISLLNNHSFSISGSPKGLLTKGNKAVWWLENIN